jgi:hypothetical protein
MNRWLIATVALLTLALCSCVKFSRQTMTMHHDQAADRVLIFQVYEGIQGSEEALTEKEQQELASVFSGERTFFFANWLFEYNRKVVEDSVTKARQRLQVAAGQPALAPAEREAAEATVALGEAVLAHVKVTNGRFYRNSAGQLCGYQQVTIEQVSKLVTVANASINRFVLAKLPATATGGEALRRAAASRGHQWIALAGNRLRFQIPATAEEYWQKRNELGKQLQDAVYAPETTLDALRAKTIPVADWWMAPSQSWFSDQMVTLELGQDAAAPVTLAITLDPAYRDNLAEHAGAAYGIHEVDVTAIRQAFFTAK